MVKKILIGAGIVLMLLVAAVAVLGLIAPTELYVEREVVIDQPVDVVFKELQYLKGHGQWSPWEKFDPKLKKTYRGTDGEVGFVSAWNSDHEKVGEGEQEITKIVPGERIDYELRFKRPMEATNHAWLATEAVGADKTKVKWGLEGKLPFPGNVFCLLMGLEKQLAAQLDEGLEMLKNKLEKS